MTKECRILALGIGLLIAIGGCVQPPGGGGETGTAAAIVTAMTNSITQMGTEAETVADVAAETGLASDETRNGLAQYHFLFDFMLVASSIDSDGIIMAIEPEANSANEGNDISHLDNIQQHQSLQTPYLSDFFDSTLDDTLLTLHWPIYGEDQAFIGSIAGLFDAELWGPEVIDPVMYGTDYDCYIIGTDGLIIYDSRQNYIGENVLVADHFNTTPENTAFWQSVTEYTAGTGTFTLDDRTLIANWTTFNMYHAEWRVLVYEVDQDA